MISAADLDILARTILGEARGESYAGKVAVGRCILTRWRSGKWFAGKTVAATAQKRAQFSCWLESDPNRAKILSAAYDDAAFRDCMRAALDAIDGKGDAWLKGATHYHADYIDVPKWAKGREPVGRIGRHIFYSNID